KSDIQLGGSDALAAFWAEMAANGTPIFERVAAAPESVSATFIWRGGADTRRVTVRMTDHQDEVMQTLPNTDVWYQTILVPRKLRTEYRLGVRQAESPSLVLEPDPLNRRKVETRRDDFDMPETFSILEPPDASPLPDWIQKKADVP